jgi:Bacterial protein of unknown function (DUF853)
MLGGSRAIFRSRRRGPPLADEGAPPLVGASEGEQGFVFARRTSGERALPADRGYLFLSPQRLCRHLLVCGATGSGKTETVMRLAWAVAKASDAQVFYLDGKGDSQNAERFLSLMAQVGRDARVFPAEPICGWRGSAQEVKGRLIEVIDYAAEGPAAFYRDIARTVISLVCEHPEGAPRSSREVLARMNLGALVKAHGAGGAAGALQAEQVRQVRMRYEAFFSQCRTTLDGSWCWDEADAAYLLFDTLSLREEASSLARFIFEDFSCYFSARKDRERLCLLVVDEFAALSERSGMAARLEQARSFQTAIVLCPQVVSGMGDQEEQDRILGSVQTVICHRVNTPEALIALAGTRQVPEYSSEIGPSGSTGHGSARIQHQYKVDPNRVRQLPAGVAYVISQGRACKAKVLRAPEPENRVSLPAAKGPPAKPTRKAARAELPF